MQEAVELEERQNAKETRRSHGQPLKYGMMVQVGANRLQVPLHRLRFQWLVFCPCRLLRINNKVQE
jgi:hypothetical protein